MLRKYASFEVLEARLGQVPVSLQRTAHRVTFDYEPRPGFLYVRSRAISSRTNDNFDNFPAEEIAQAYATFIGKPVFVNHHNDNHRKARGVIIDAALHEDRLPDGTPDVWAEVLMEIDAVRYPKLAQAILRGRIDRTSMGCDVAYSVCSVCNNRASTPLDYCRHIPAMKGQKIRRKTAAGTQEDVLVYEKCYGLKFFENSVLVEDPADPTAYFLEVDDRGIGGGYEGNVPRTAKVAAVTNARGPSVAAQSRNLVCGRCGHEWTSRAQYRTQCPNCGAEESVRVNDRATARSASRRTATRRATAEVRYPCPHCGDEVEWAPAGATLRPGMSGSVEDYWTCRCGASGHIDQIEREGSRSGRKIATKTAAMPLEDLQRLDQIIEKHLGHYNGTVSWLLQNKPDASVDQVANTILDRDSAAIRKMIGGRDPWMKDQAEWMPIFMQAVEAMLDEIRSGGTTASRRMARLLTAVEQDLWNAARVLGETLTGQGALSKQFADWYMDNARGTDMETAFRRWETERAPEATFTPPAAAEPERLVARRVRAYGEVTAPAQVDTMRDDHCPVCGEQESFDGERCSVCQFIKPPDEFMDPDLSVAQETDLRQQADDLDDAADAQEALGDEVAPDEGVPGEEDPAGAQVPDAFTLEKSKDDPGAPAPEEDPNIDGQIDADVVGPGDAEAEAPEDDEDHTDAPDDDDVEEGEDEDDADDEDDDAPFNLKKKKPKKATRRHPRGTHGEGRNVTMRPTLKALAEQQILLEANRKAIERIAQVAGLDIRPIYADAQRRTAALNRTADVDNPSQPIPEPGAEAPSQSTEDALGNLNDADLETPGEVSNEGVTPSATTDVTQPGGAGTPSEAELGNLSDLDVTAPVEGTQGPLPDADVKPESDVQAIDEVRTDTAFPEQFTGSKDQQRTFAALRLARLRIQAGIAEGTNNDLSLGQTIASSTMRDEDIKAEIVTLTKVQAAKQATVHPAPTARTAGTRTVPSLGGQVVPEGGAPINGSGANANVTAALEDSIF